MADLFRVRTIGRIGASTPLVVPSYSSRGFPDVNGIVKSTASGLYGPCLFSAFDLASGCVDADLTSIGDVVILDSGVFETMPYQAAVDEHGSPPSPVAWDVERHRAYLANVSPVANVVAVSFDRYGAPEMQLEQAGEDWARAPSAARSFLAKPIEPGRMLDPSAFRDVLALPDVIDVLGVTEKELGASLLDRCKALIVLRGLLGPDIPIHVFGTLMPSPMLAYFLCGADVFDGLNWLRLDYGSDSIGPISERSIARSEWGWEDDRIRLVAWLQNLRHLRAFQWWLASVARGEGLEGGWPGRPPDNTVWRCVEVFEAARRATEGVTHGG